MRGASPRPRRVALSHGEQLVAVLVIEVLENCPYTTSLRVRQEQHPAWLPAPQLEVRAYHDARMAEVVGAARSRSFLGRYPGSCANRSEEHTSELQSRPQLVCRLLLEKKKDRPGGHLAAPAS